MTTQLVPKRRFKGFKGSWKLVQVNEVAEFNPSSILPKKFYYVDLESVEEMKLKKASKEKLETAPSRAQRVARKGDIFYQTVRPYQRNNYLFNLSKRTYVFSTGYAQLRPSIDSSYLINQLITPRFSRDVLNRCTGTGYPAISPYNLSTIAIKIPKDKRESQKIGEFFKVLDARIANQERKIEKIKAIKQAYLTEMFPQEGEDTPRRRFEGFHTSWKEFKLGEVTSINTGDSDVKEAVLDGEYPFFIRSKKVERSNVYTFDGEAILIPGEGKLGEIFHYYNGKFNYHQRVYKVSNFDDNISGLFIFYTMQVTFKRHAQKETVKATVDSLRLPTLENYRLSLPGFEEQQKIGEFFKTLDEKIEAEEKKLEKLKKMKEAFLEEMFV